MKIFIFVFLSLITLPSIVFSAQEVTILVGDDQFPPLKLTDKDGKITGIYPEIIKKAISRMPDYTFNFKELPWSRVKLHIKEGRSFAMLPPYFHAHDWLTDDDSKRPYIWPYSLPLFTQSDIVICDVMKLKSPRPNWPEDYQDLLFARFTGDGRGGEKFHQMIEKKEIKVIFSRSTLHALKLVLLGRADCMVLSRMPFHWLIKEMKQSGDYARLGEVVTLKISKTIGTDEGYLGYTDINAEKNFPFKKDFVIKFDIEIFRMKKRGEIQEIIDGFVK